MDKFDKNSYRADERGTSDSWITNIKTELHLKFLHLSVLTYPTTKIDMGVK